VGKNCCSWLSSYPAGEKVATLTGFPDKLKSGLSIVSIYRRNNPGPALFSDTRDRGSILIPERHPLAS
jgi:hypothetical protein